MVTSEANSISEETTKEAIATPEITKGARVRVYCPGSKRHEKQGVVARFSYEKGIKWAVVIL
ncbi:MAG: hypothetical protein KME21_30925, partial [Desmonostoc vinosum HA7617-LM4]|nr:hypothetical protein [Desmonostoc vinosum HA7617-LM4]